MAYTKTVWTDRDVEHPNRYKDQNNNQLILTRDEGTVTEAGTFLNSTVMNNIEDGIETLDTAVSDLDTAVSELDTAVSELDTAVSEKANIDDCKRDIIWTNPNPSSDYASGTISGLDLSKYSRFIVVYKFLKNGTIVGSTEVTYTDTWFRFGIQSWYATGGVDGSANRDVKITNSSIQFGTATVYGLKNTSYVNANAVDAMIPIQVLGYVY